MSPIDSFLLQIFSGLANGSIYAALGLALVMIYQSTHHINFAQGEMATFATFIAWTLIERGVPYWLAFFLTMGIAFVGGLLVQRIFIKPVERAPVLNNVIVFVGLLVIFNAMSGWIFGQTVKAFNSPFPTASVVLPQYISGHQLGSLGVTLGVLLVVFLFFKYTPIGLAMRAAAQNPDSASLVGIPVSWMLALGWGLASAIGAVAGMMMAPVVFLDPNMMGGILLYGFAAALLGGIDNPWGAVIGGFIVGVLENILGAYVIGTELKLSVALVLIVGTLTLMPNGLFGRKVVTRV
jgi:branched-chain amino acid transport system permease protein